MSAEGKIPVVAVVGPTASGKTALAVELAKRFDAEILSFDSMQLYKGMDIATAKPSVEEMQGIPHHMISVVENTEAFSVAKYKECADRIAEEIRSRGKNVIMVGGTGLYLDTVIQNIELLPSEDTSLIREQLKAELSEKGPEAMYNRLTEVDPKTAEQLHVNNTGRVLRALEVYISTGHTMSYQVENSKNTPSKYEAVYIGLNAEDRQFLYDRIDRRVDIMLENGLLHEAREYADSERGKTARQAIGLKELAPFIKGEKSLDECTESLKRETRRYAKRQLTWFKRNKDINWIYIDRADSFPEIVSDAVGFIERSGIFKGD